MTKVITLVLEDKTHFRAASPSAGIKINRAKKAPW